ncbi:MAG TPA: phenylalanine--tRNA ligase subunit beta [Coleofasciculaceae cyanobacterium]|jgi:phenylalanyl-tRNA synthetase beta chain
MRVSLEWLKQYVDIAGLSAEQIAEALTNAGLEVEHVDHLGPKFEGVVVGRVQAVDPHPNADKLRLVTVSLGGGDRQQVVCGAPNVREGIFIAFAKEGAKVLNRKDGTTFTLGRAKIRGVESAGMVCSLDELGLEDQYPRSEDGIWPMDSLVSESQLGQDLKTVLGLGGDSVLEVAPTANRGDLMSMIGVAREVSALFDRTLYHPHYPNFNATGEKTSLRINLRHPEACWYYGGVMMKNLKIGPSPEWMSRRLQAAGVRSINNVVDITNYVMLELGQPLHAFDWDRLGNHGDIDVRRAREGEKLVTLDDIERKLTSESVVVTMNDRAVALAGLMGGAETEIDGHSRSLFLESAYFPSAMIRRSGKSVGLRSEASARFERGVDLENCRNALLRAADLLRELAGAEFVRLLESSPPVVEAPKITLNQARIRQVLGVDVDPDTVARILKKLGFRLQSGMRAASLVVMVPSYRQNDVCREIDLIEEVARIYGYDQVPYTLPKKTMAVPVSLRSRMLGKLHAVMQGQGLQEVVTTSLIGESLLEKTGFSINREQMVSVINSHSTDHTLMRQSLLPNLIEVARFNQAQGAEDVWIYELGRTYFKLGKANFKNSGVSERLSLSGLVCGSALSGSWHRQEAADFYLLKGISEALFGALAISQLSFAPNTETPYLHPGRAASILMGEKAKEIGILGELHPELQQTMKFRHPVFVFELNVEAIYKALKRQDAETQVVRISPYPAIKRDMAFLAPNEISHQSVMDTLRSMEEPLLREVALFDEYRSEQLGADKRSLAYRLTFQSEESTMTDTEVDQRFGRLKEQLAEKLPIQFR